MSVFNSLKMSWWRQATLSFGQHWLFGNEEEFTVQSIVHTDQKNDL